MTAPTDWVPPSEEAPEVPPVPAEDVTTGPVAEAPAEPAPVVEPGVSNATPADPTSAGPAETPSAAADVQVQAQATTAGNAAPVTVERSAATAAARAFHVLGHLEAAVHAVRAEIQKYVPPEVLAAAETEALAALRALL